MAAAMNLPSRERKGEGKKNKIRIRATEKEEDELQSHAGLFDVAHLRCFSESDIFAPARAESPHPDVRKLSNARLRIFGNPEVRNAPLLEHTNRQIQV